MPKKVTIQGIADNLGLSKSTVSKALSGATDISESTRESVMKCAAELGYEINPDKLVRVRNAAVLVYGIHYGTSDQFGYELIAGIQAAAIENGIGVSILPVTFEQVESGDYDRLVIERGYEGIFFLGFCPHEKFLERNRGRNLPMVVLDNYIENPMIARVGCDNRSGIKQIVNYLYSMGHRRIGFLGGEADSIVTVERMNAYLECLSELGLEADKDIIKCGHFTGKGIKKITLDIAKHGATAIVCISDLIASSAISELSKAGYAVPGDISVTGYDNLPVSKYCNPPITTVEQNRLHIGKTAFNTMQMIKSGIYISSVMLHTSLVERGSVLRLSG